MSLTFLRKTTGNIDFTILCAVVRAKSDDVFISISPSQPSFIAFNGIFAPQIQNSVQYSGRLAVFISVKIKFVFLCLLACVQVWKEYRSQKIIYSGRIGK